MRPQAVLLLVTGFVGCFMLIGMASSTQGMQYASVLWQWVAVPIPDDTAPLAPIAAAQEAQSSARRTPVLCGELQPNSYGACGVSLQNGDFRLLAPGSCGGGQICVGMPRANPVTCECHFSQDVFAAQQAMKP